MAISEQFSSVHVVDEVDELMNWVTVPGDRQASNLSTIYESTIVAVNLANKSLSSQGVNEFLDTQRHRIMIRIIRSFL